MATRLIIDGNAVYEIDEECLECQKKKTGYKEEYVKKTVRSTDDTKQKPPD